MTTRIVALVGLIVAATLAPQAAIAIDQDQYKLVQKRFPNAYAFMNDFFNKEHPEADQSRLSRFGSKVANDIQIKAGTLGTDCIDQMEARTKELAGCAALEKLLKPYAYLKGKDGGAAKQEEPRKFSAVCIWSRAFGRYDESGDGVKSKDCLFPLMGMEIVQKVNGGYMISTDDGVLSYLETPQAFQKGPFPYDPRKGESYVYIAGNRKYTGLDGFEKDSLALKVYSGSIPEQFCTPACRPHR